MHLHLLRTSSRRGCSILPARLSRFVPQISGYQSYRKNVPAEFLHRVVWKRSCGTSPDVYPSLPGFHRSDSGFLYPGSGKLPAGFRQSLPADRLFQSGETAWSNRPFLHQHPIQNKRHRHKRHLWSLPEIMHQCLQEALFPAGDNNLHWFFQILCGCICTAWSHAGQNPEK